MDSEAARRKAREKKAEALERANAAPEDPGHALREDDHTHGATKSSSRSAIVNMQG
jgi:hypothetical protein